MEYKVLNNQSLIDIACEVAGNADAVFDLMKSNDYIFDLDFATEPTVDNIIILPSTYENFTKQVADYFINTSKNIATAEANLTVADYSLDYSLDYVS